MKKSTLKKIAQLEKKVNDGIQLACELMNNGLVPEYSIDIVSLDAVVSQLRGFIKDAEKDKDNDYDKYVKSGAAKRNREAFEDLKNYHE